jgi:hypothetical protein
MNYNDKVENNSDKVLHDSDKVKTNKPNDSDKKKLVNNTKRKKI